MLSEHVFLLHDEAISSELKILQQLHFFDNYFIVDKYLKSKASVSFIKQQDYIFLLLETEVVFQYKNCQVPNLYPSDLPAHLLQYEIWGCQTQNLFGSDYLSFSSYDDSYGVPLFFNHCVRRLLLVFRELARI